MTPDVIVSWPRTCDYPLWRRFLAANRRRFGNVYVVLTEHAGRDISGFIRHAIGDLAYVMEPGPGEWRDAAVNAALDLSTSQWVWFTEQDFLIHEPERFWDAVRSGERFEAVGWRDETRWHPSCLFVRRAAIEATSRYFGPEPVDHFVTFSRELRGVYDLEADLHRGLDFEHLQGLSENHRLIEAGIDAGVFRRDRFREYLRDCLAAGVELEPAWRATAERELGMVSV